MSDIHSFVSSYITDTLEHDERSSFELHLDSCASCLDDVLDLQETMAEVSAQYDATPPPALRSSILDAIASTPMLPADDHAEQAPAPDAPSNVVTADFGRPRRPVATWLAAAAAVLAVALGGVTVWQQSELQSVQAADAQRFELLAAPDLQVTQTTLDDGAQLTYLVSTSREEAIVASTSFPAPGEDRSWQLWVVRDEKPRSVGIVDEGGRLQVSVEDVVAGDAMAITNEPRGGSPQPTGTIQAVVELKAP